MPKFSTIKAGDVLYDVNSERAGNTTMRRQGVWKVEVLSVEADHAIVSWNGNKPQRYYPRQIEKLRRSEPQKLNRHWKGCSGYHDPVWVRNCTCNEIAAKVRGR